MDFCDQSGQKVNVHKSLLWFFPNTPTYLKNTVCTRFGKSATVNLSTYLGVPLLHGRMTKLTYKALIEKAQQKLAGWKSRLLSKAAKTILIRSTLSALPSYLIQTVLLPKGVVAELEKPTRRFFQGEEANSRKLHSISWVKLCCPRKIGGLGFPNLLSVNKALMVKIGRRLLQEPHTLYNQFLIQKYGGQTVVHLDSNKNKPQSMIWKGVMEG